MFNPEVGNDDTIALEFMKKRYDNPHSFVSDSHLHTYNQMLYRHIHKMFYKQFDEYRHMKGNDLHVVIVRKLMIDTPRTKDGEQLTVEMARLKGCNFMSQISCHMEYRTFSSDPPKAKLETVNKNYEQGALISRLSADDRQKYPYLIREHIYPKYPFFQMPVMERSIACPSTDGLEFSQCMHSFASCIIVSGIERILMKRDRPKFSEPLHYIKKTGPEVEIRSEHVNKFRSTSTLYISTKKKRYQPRTVFVKIPYVKRAIPLHILYRALGWTDDMVYTSSATQKHQTLAEKITGAVFCKLSAVLGEKDPVLLRSIIDEFYKSLVPPQRQPTGEADSSSFSSVLGKRKFKAVENVRSQRASEHTQKILGWKIQTQREALKYIAEASLPIDDVDGLDWNSLQTGEIKQLEPMSARRPAAPGVTGPARYDDDRMVYTASKTLASEFLPHVANAFHYKDGDLEYHKGMLLAEAVADILLMHHGIIHEDQRDHMKNKNIDSQGDLFCYLLRQLFRTHYKRVRHAICVCLEHEPIIRVKSVFADKTITRGLLYSTKTGNWTTRKMISKNKKQNTGVSQIRNTMNISSTMAQLTSLTTPINPNGRQIDVRRIKDFDGIICYAFTPEGADGCGVRKQNAISFFLSTGSDDQFVIYVLFQNGVVDTRKIDFHQSFADAKLLITSHTLDAATAKTRAYNGYRIKVNGKWIGMYNADIDILKKKLLFLRRNLLIDWYTSIVRNDETRELQITTSAARSLRCLLLVHNFLKLTREQFYHMSWFDCIKAQVIEFVDKVEEDTIEIAADFTDYMSRIKAGKNVEHAIIHPSFILGLSSSQIPFLDHNQSPRNTYECNMLNQTMSIPFTNFLRRMDTMFYILYYPMTPWVETTTLHFVGCQDLAMGQDSSIAIMSYTGYNQEDSSIRSRQAIELGFGRTLRFSTSTFEEKHNGSAQNMELFGKPNPLTCEAMKFASYDTIEDDGLPVPGMYVRAGEDVMCGKTMPVDKFSNGKLDNAAVDEASEVNEKTSHCASTVASHKEEGYVDTVLITNNPNGRRIAKIRTCKPLGPVVGDKFASRHGQKGTAGDIMDLSDMPYDEDGCIPTAMTNPHAYPSRMTIGELIEKLVSILSSNTSTPIYSIPFTRSFIQCREFRDQFRFSEFYQSSKDPIDIDEQLPADEKSKVNQVIRILHAFGLSESCRMYNGTNGQLLGGDSKYGEGWIFKGSTYEQRLAHNAEDKQHARAKGPRQSMTNQATEGKSKDGGLRYGEMEMWCGYSHGAASFLYERLLVSADKHRMHVCAKCGLQAIAVISEGKYQCRRCGNDESVHQVFVPHAFKLFKHELIAMGVVPRLQLKSPFVSQKEQITQ